jgi:hypothetical protein
MLGMKNFQSEGMNLLAAAMAAQKNNLNLPELKMAIAITKKEMQSWLDGEEMFPKGMNEKNFTSAFEIAQRLQGNSSVE